MYIVHLKRPWQFAKRYPPHDLLRAMPLCCALFVVLLGGLLWCRHLITCASDVCCIFIAIHCQHCSYVMYMFSGKSHFDVVRWVTCVHSQWAGLVFVYIHRRLRINQLIELRSKWNYGIYGTHQNGLFTNLFCRFVISKTCVTLLHMHRCQFYSAWFLIGSYCTGDWKLKILIAICLWHSITSRIRKILVANASKLVALYSTGYSCRWQWDVTTYNLVL